MKHRNTALKWTEFAQCVNKLSYGNIFTIFVYLLKALHHQRLRDAGLNKHTYTAGLYIFQNLKNTEKEFKYCFCLWNGAMPFTKTGMGVPS
jgi:hypothetical protein